MGHANTVALAFLSDAFPGLIRNCGTAKKPRRYSIMAVRRLPTAGQAVRIQAAVPDARKGKRGKAGHNRTKKILSGQNFYRWCFPILFYPVVLAACSFFVRLDGAWFAQLLKPSFLLPNFYLSLLTIPVYGCLAAALWFLVRASGAESQILEWGSARCFNCSGVCSFLW